MFVYYNKNINKCLSIFMQNRWMEKMIRWSGPQTHRWLGTWLGERICLCMSFVYVCIYVFIHT